MQAPSRSFDPLRFLELDGCSYSYYALSALGDLEAFDARRHRIDRLPYALRLLIENSLRAYAQGRSGLDDVISLMNWHPRHRRRATVRFRPARVLMQDFTGVPALVDLASLRDRVEDTGGDPSLVNPTLPTDLVVDHSVIIEKSQEGDALQYNMAREVERNAERYRFLRWAEGAFENLRIVPPGQGICHQVNLEYLATVVTSAGSPETPLLFPDSVIGTDSHTTMINALGVLGWGVGGLEAEAAMLGRALEVPLPEVVGLRLRGGPAEGVGATDIALMLTQKLREAGVVGSFVEFLGEGLDSLSLADRATLANMAPEYGSTCAYFPIDAETLRYLTATGRPSAQVDKVKAYAQAQALWRDADTPDPEYSRTIDIDLGAVSPALAGPNRPQDRVTLGDLADDFKQRLGTGGRRERSHMVASESYAIRDGSVVVAAITSCTNTSNPAAMVTAGLLARNAVRRGLRSKPWVATSFSPGSTVVSDYLEDLGVQDDLDRLGFRVAAFGCGACVGNTGPLNHHLASTIAEHDLAVAAVLSGNRNFEARINPLVRANYLASPALVVAYALAGTLCLDLRQDPIGIDGDAEPVFLRDIWPSGVAVSAAVAKAVQPTSFVERYARLFEGTKAWQALCGGTGPTYDWDRRSTYIRRPPFSDLAGGNTDDLGRIGAARILLLLGDGVTTDHISPAGPIPEAGPAGDYLRGCGIETSDFNTFGARRGNHDVMVRGAFANPRLRNELLSGRQGGFTRIFPSGREVSIFEAASHYRRTHTPLVIVAGRDYGGGSSRDWAAKGTALLGVKAVIAESFERIHRANLVAMGVLPLEFPKGLSWRSLGLEGCELLSISAPEGLSPRARLVLSITRPRSSGQTVGLLCRIDTALEMETYRAGGLLPVMAKTLDDPATPSAHLPSAIAANRVRTIRPSNEPAVRSLR